MAGVFDSYRHHKKLVFFVIFLAMVLFLMGTALISLFGGREGSGSQDPIIATAKFGNIRASQLSHIMRQQNQWNILQSGKQNSRSMTQAQALDYLLELKKAEQLGIVVSDNSARETMLKWATSFDGIKPLDKIKSWMSEYKISDDEAFSMARRHRMRELMGELIQITVLRNPPDQEWDAYRQLNQKIKAEAVALPVEQYIAQVTDPEEAKLEKFFEEHKNQYSANGEPGFKLPYRASFQFFKADLADFQAKAEAEVTEEQIKEYYDKNRDRFIEFDLPAAGTPSEDKKEDGKKEDGKIEEGKKEEPKSEEKKEADKKDTEKKDAENKNTENKEPEKKPNEKAGSSLERRKAGPAAKFVSLLVADGEAAEEKKQEQKPDEKKTEPKSEEKKEESKVEGKLPDVKGLSVPDFQLNGKPGEPLLDLKAPPRYKPLDAMRGDIRRILAGEKATKAAVEALNSATQVVNDFARVRSEWKLKVATNPKEPAPLGANFAETAKKFGLKMGDTGLISQEQAAKDAELSKLFVQLLVDGRGMFFPTKAFGKHMVEFHPEMYTMNNQAIYQIWLTDEAQEKVPAFKDAKDTVLKSWKQVEARKKAQEEADRLLKVAKKDPKITLQESLTKESGKDVKEIGPFSWRYTKGVPGREQIMTTEEIAGVDEPGEDFLRTAYNLDEGEVGLAWNKTKSIVYILRISEFDPSRSGLFHNFNTLKSRGEVASLIDSNFQIGTAYRNWLNALKDEFGVKPAMSIATSSGSKDDTSGGAFDEE